MTKTLAIAEKTFRAGIGTLPCGVFTKVPIQTNFFNKHTNTVLNGENVPLAKVPVTLPEVPVLLPKVPVTFPKVLVLFPKVPVTLPKVPVLFPKEPVSLPEVRVLLPKERLLFQNRSLSSFNTLLLLIYSKIGSFIQQKIFRVIFLSIM